MLEQLKEFKKEEIIKIVVDGIFHTKKDVVLKNVFVNEPKEITLNSPSHSYFSNDKCLTTFKVGAFKKYEQVECHIGVGGGGKTHNNLIDKGLVGLCYFAPSWKLARNKQKEYGCHGVRSIRGRTDTGRTGRFGWRSIRRGLGRSLYRDTATE